MTDRVTRNLRALDSLTREEYDAHARATYGLNNQDLATVAKMGAKLAHAGATLSNADIANLQRIYRDQADPRTVADLASRLNSAPSQRQELFASLLAGDREGLATGIPSSEYAKGAAEFFSNFSQYSLADEVERGLDARRPKNEVTIARVAEDPMSTRAIIERQFGPTQSEALDHASEHVQREFLGHKMDRSLETLKDEGVSTRDTLAAAWDFENAAQEGRDRSLLPAED